jgi:hypothetical protein
VLERDLVVVTDHHQCPAVDAAQVRHDQGRLFRVHPVELGDHDRAMVGPVGR